MKNKNLQKIKTVILIVFISCLSASTLAQDEQNPDFSGGTGSEADPFLISNKAELINLRGGESWSYDWKYYKLTADIDYEGGIWETYHSVNNNFQNRLSFDGDGHVIRNMVIESGGSSRVAMFGELTGYVRNVGFENITVNGQSATFAGVIAGHVWDKASRGIENCYVVNSVINGNTGVGGLAGVVYPGQATYKNCFVDAVINGKSSVGGLFGKVDISAVGALENCTFYGSISYDTESDPVGVGGAIAGIMGAEHALPASMYYLASVSGNTDQGSAVAVTSEQLADVSAYSLIDFSGSIWKMGAEYPVLSFYTNTPTATDIASQKEISIYPNPASNFIIVRGKDSDQICIYSTTGQLLKLVKNTNRMNVSDLNDGVYVVQVKSGNDNYTSKITKK